VPIAANASYYASIVHEKAILRRLVDAGTKIAQMGYAGEGEIDHVVDRAQAEIFSIGETAKGEDYQPLSAIMESTLDEIEAISNHNGDIIGIPTGLADLDELTNGFQPGQMIIVAGRSGSGKSTLVNLIARFYDVDDGRICLDGTPLAELPLAHLRQQLGWVGQQVVLFDELEMPKTKRTKTGYTTDADALQSLFDKTGHPFLQHLLAHRDATRLKITVDGLLAAVGSDGRIHTTFNQTIAATGRLSSTEPNLQNIPIRTDAGRRIRDAFVVGSDNGTEFAELMTADYSQIEMRIMAHLSKDDGLIEAFRTGEDLHSFVASRAFGVPIDEVTAELRRRVKAMSYGLAYGLSAYGLAAQLKISTEEAKVQMEQYFSRFGGVRDYLEGVVDQARKDGYTSTVLGRRRYLPELDSSNRQVREAAERAALNAPIQGSAADIIKVAMINVDTALQEAGLASRMLLQVHDELLFEVAPGERDALEALVREQMGNAYPLDVPLEVSVGFGRSWDSAAH